MPRKDVEARREYNSEYRKRDYVKIKNRVRQQTYSQTPKYKFIHQRKEARQRNIEWLLSFDEWIEIWEKSGRFEERGPLGYQMCRYKDEGPYSIGNVYIAHHAQNKGDAYRNGKTSLPNHVNKYKETSICQTI